MENINLGPSLFISGPFLPPLAKNSSSWDSFFVLSVHGSSREERAIGIIIREAIKTASEIRSTRVLLLPPPSQKMTRNINNLELPTSMLIISSFS